MNIDDIIKDLEVIRDARRPSENTARRVGSALIEMLQYLNADTDEYLHKNKDDVMKGLLTLMKGAVVGDGKIHMNPDGSIICDNIRVNGSAIFDELVFNHQNVLEGDTYFTDKGIIDKAEAMDDGTYRLTFRKEYDKDVITFHVNDILLGKVNNLDQAKTYYSFYCRITSVDTNANTATVTVYDDGDVPGGKNYPPVAAARVIRWGNSPDAARQSVWFVSSNDGRWLFLQGVNKPVLEDSDTGSNYAALFGLPKDINALHKLLENKQIDKNLPVLYAQTLFYQNLIQVDYTGAPQYQARDCGLWTKNRKYINGYDETAKGYYKDRVWWKGCYWECAVASSTDSEPRYGNADWTCILGGSNMAINIYSTYGNFFPIGKDWQTDIVAEVWNAEMRLKKEELTKCNITWTRESSDEDGDTAWNAKHKTFTDLTLPISSNTDLPAVWTSGSKVGYRITIIFPDNSQIEESYSIAV